MERMVSTSRFLLWSVTVVFFVRTWYMYLVIGWGIYVNWAAKLELCAHTNLGYTTTSLPTSLKNCNTLSFVSKTWLSRNAGLT